MAIVLSENYNNTNYFPDLNNKFFYYPTFRETQGELFVIREFVNPGDNLELRELNPNNNNFEIVFDAHVQNKNGKDIIGIFDIEKIYSDSSNNCNSITINGDGGYITTAAVWYDTYIGFSLFWGPTVDNLFVHEFYTNTSGISNVRLNQRYENGYIDFNLNYLNNTRNGGYVQSGGMDFPYNKYLSITPSAESKTYNSETFYRFNKPYYLKGFDFCKNTIWQEFSLINLWGNNDKLLLEYKGSNDGVWSNTLIWDGAITEKTITDLNDVISFSVNIFGVRNTTPYPTYSPVFFYTPYALNSFTSVSVREKTGLYSITSSQNDTRNWSMYLLYGDDYPQGILGGTVVNGKLYIVYRDVDNIIVYSKSDYWIDDQETNNTATPYYKEVQFNPADYQRETEPYAVSGNKILGGIIYFNNKIHLLIV